MFKKVFYYDFVEFNNKFYMVAINNGSLAFVSSDKNQFFEFNTYYPHHMLVRSQERVADFSKEIASYLKGQLKKFTIPIDISLFGTEQQRNVLQQVQNIPYGRQMSATELANSTNLEVPVRVVENAVILNPVLFVIPTHRINAPKRVTNSYRGGPTMLNYLLDLEKGRN